MRHRVLSSNRSTLAEGPIWHEEHGKVYWTDIDSGSLYSYDYETAAVEKVHEGSPIGGFTIQEDGALLLFREKGAIELWTGSDVVTLIEEIPDERETRFNDVAADPEGRVFCGTMPAPDRKGRLYRLDHDGSLRIVQQDIGCSNGMGWSPDRQTMYYTDTGAGTIFAFDYDRATGEMANRRPFFTLNGGWPDGMTVDADGNIWTAIWGGGCLIHIDPSGAEIQRIDLPANQITCPTFGGPGYEHLFVTAAGGQHADHGPGAGELMVIEGAARGVPEFRSRITVKKP